MIESIESRPNLELLEFEEHFEHQRPVVVPQAAGEWKAVREWTPCTLAERLGNQVVKTCLSDNARFFCDSSGPTFHTKTMPFDEVMERIESEPTPPNQYYYIHQQSLPNEFPELVADIEIPKWLKEERLQVINLWLGAKGVRGTLHYDAKDNFFVQVYGRKKFTIFSPDETDRLSPRSPEQTFPHMSPIDVQTPDFVTFPEFENAHAYHYELEAGDLLYLPAFWWHSVESLSVNISVNFWTLPTFLQTLAPNSLRFLPAAYRQDRLAAKKSLLEYAYGMTLMDAARVCVSEGANLQAALFAGAGLHERLVARAEEGGASKVESMSPDLLPLLVKTNKVTAEDGRSIQETFGRIDRLAPGPIEPAQVQELIGDIDRLLETLNQK